HLNSAKSAALKSTPAGAIPPSPSIVCRGRLPKSLKFQPPISLSSRALLSAANSIQKMPEISVSRRPRSDGSRRRGMYLPDHLIWILGLRSTRLTSSSKSRTGTWLIACPGTHGEYDKRDAHAFLKQLASGALSMGCLHASCSLFNGKGNHWQEYRAIAE